MLLHYSCVLMLSWSLSLSVSVTFLAPDLTNRGAIELETDRRDIQ